MTIAQDILGHAISQLDRNALEQIARHCEFNLELAKRHAKEEGHKASFELIQSPANDALRGLASYCRMVLQMG